MTNPRTGPLTWLAVALIVAIGLMIMFGTLTMTTYGGYYGMMGGGAWGWGFVMMAVPGVVLVLILLAALRGLGEPPMAAGGPAAAASPLGILDERYARGEVSREEYLRARGDLGQGRAHS
jgi:putative membrane protein